MQKRYIVSGVMIVLVVLLVISSEIITSRPGLSLSSNAVSLLDGKAIPKELRLSADVTLSADATSGLTTNIALQPKKAHGPVILDVDHFYYDSTLKEFVRLHYLEMIPAEMIESKWDVSSMPLCPLEMEVKVDNGFITYKETDDSKGSATVKKSNAELCAAVVASRMISAVEMKEVSAQSMIMLNGRKIPEYVHFEATVERKPLSYTAMKQNSDVPIYLVFDYTDLVKEKHFTGIGESIPIDLLEKYWSPSAIEFCPKKMVVSVERGVIKYRYNFSSEIVRAPDAELCAVVVASRMVN